MKTIYLTRHAKSDKGNPLLKDIDRPLNERGYRDAYFMSTLMKMEKEIPDVLLTSPAVRAYSTALIFLKTYGFNTIKLFLKDLLFEENAAAYLNEIKALPEQYNSMMLFAHNPTITEVANLLSEKSIEDFSTCGIVRLDFEIKKWEDIEGTKGKQIFFELPKNHMAGGF